MDRSALTSPARRSSYLLVNPRGKENIERIAGLVSENIARPIAVGGSQLVVNASIGVALYPGDGATGDELVRCADTAMYRAKNDESGCAFFDAARTGSALAPVAPGR